MKTAVIAITGGTGFIGRHTARLLASEGHEVVLVARGQDKRDATTLSVPGVSFAAAAVDDQAALERAFAGCSAVAHCAGINRELGAQTYKRVHVDGTRAVLAAARKAGVGKVLLLSFLRARPGCGSAYHEFKWEAEELVRGSGLDYTILKCGIVYGRGDHMLGHLSRALYTIPVFARVGFSDAHVRPVCVEDVAGLVKAALVDGRLSRETVAVTGPEELPFGEAVRRVGEAIGRRPWVLSMPVGFHLLLAAVLEPLMRVPLVSTAQVRMLAEGIVEPGPGCRPLPEDLQPCTRFDADSIRRGLPEPGGFGLSDLRCWPRPGYG